MPPSISVIIPAYNRPDLLRETVLSIVAQTLPPAEIIVVDDGSTTSLAPALGDLGPTVRFHRQQNAGITAARNAGVRISSSPWLAFCDHDDLWRPDKLEQQIELHLQHPELLYSFTDFSIVTGESWSTETKFGTLPPGFFNPADPQPTSAGHLVLRRSLHDSLLLRQPIWPSTVVIARTLFDRMGGFRPELGRNVSEDLEFTLRCLRHPPTGVLRAPLVGVRKHGSNVSGNPTTTILHQIEVFRYVLDHHPISPGTRQLIEQTIATRSLIGSHSAFTEGRFADHQQLLQNVPAHHLTPRIRLKQAVSRLPPPIAHQFRVLLSLFSS